MRASASFSVASLRPHAHVIPQQLPSARWISRGVLRPFTERSRSIFALTDASASRNAS